jgi:hypothetical protein
MAARGSVLQTRGDTQRKEAQFGKILTSGNKMELIFSKKVV